MIKAPIVSFLDEQWWRFGDRTIRKYEKLGNFTIEPFGEKYYALYDGNELVCITVYKKGALEVMRRLSQKVNTSLTIATSGGLSIAHSFQPFASIVRLI